ncbi:MAG TPA: tetratricopeptide repeat protein [Thermoanaerobaculia bacterium]|jgi:tetratricopeptide (TPR) repeat protein|nr:tetratricopeptide repeat protein [Thermoanaerobaculia bacterium]
MTGYSVRDVAATLGLSESRVRAYAAFLSPARGPKNEYRFTFQDLVLLRTAKELVEARVPTSKVKRALLKLKEKLPGGRPLSAVRIAANGRDVVVQDGEKVWNPDSGQALFDFAVADIATKAAPLAKKSAAAAREREATLDAASWYELGYDLEAVAPSEARDAYRRAVELDPHHADAHVNLGRLLHEAGEPAAAESHYRIALAFEPSHVTAAFNLGVALEDLGRRDEAVAAYEKTLDADPDHGDAHFNLARLHEKAGRATAALRHLKAYRKILLAR